MKKLIAAVLFLTVAMSVPALAQDLKIGLLDMEKYSRQSDVGKDIAEQMKAKLQPKLDEIKRQEEDFNRLKDEFVKQSSAYSLEVQNAKKLELKRKGRDLEDMKLEFQRYAKAEEQKLTAPAQELMQKVAEDYARQNDYDLVLEMRVAGVLFLNEEKLDITDDLIQALNAAYKAQ